jgi:tagatose-1,6-bisphosphate aldolase
MKKLKRAFVKRSGATSRYLSDETTDVSLDNAEGKIKLRFDIKSKGGGITEIYISIWSADFQDIIESMMEADRSVTMECTSKELSKQIELQAAHDKKNRSAAFFEMEKEAKKRFDKAGAETVDLEYIVHQKIKKIATDLDFGDAT